MNSKINSQVELQVVQLEKDLPLPCYMSRGAVGMDLYAAKKVHLVSGKIKLIPAGIKVAVPFGYELQIRSRSGLAVRGIGIVNSPGTIDNDYRGEIKICLINHSKSPITINKGDRIAQAILSPVVRARIKCVDILDSTLRGEGGFGHTGR